MRPWQLREQRSCREGEETVQREAVDGFVWHPGLRISHEFRDPLCRLPRLALICVAGAGNHDDAVAGGVREMLGKIAQERDWLAAGEDVERADEKADVLYRLCAGPTGFGALLRALAPEGLTRTMLASTLHELEKDGVVCKAERWQGRVRRVDWSLTPAGEDLLPVFHALMVWGARHEPSATP